MVPGNTALRLLATGCLLLGGCMGSQWLVNRPSDATTADYIPQEPNDATADKRPLETTAGKAQPTAKISSTGSSEMGDGADDTANDPLLQRLESLRHEDPQLYADLRSALSTADPAMRATLERQFEAQLSLRGNSETGADRNDTGASVPSVMTPARDAAQPPAREAYSPPANSAASAQVVGSARATVGDYSPWYRDDAGGVPERKVESPFRDDPAPSSPTLVASRADSHSAAADPARSPASVGAAGQPVEVPAASQSASDPSSSSFASRGDNEAGKDDNSDAKDDWRALLERTIVALEDRLRSVPPAGAVGLSGVVNSSSTDTSGGSHNDAAAADVAVNGAYNGERLTADERARLETYLRLLYVAAGRHDDAVKPVTQWDEPLEEYWKNQLHGLSVALDGRGMPLVDRRAALALRHLREAESHLAAASTLDVRNLTFCTRVDSFGRYTEFDQYEFRADQEVLLYVEIDNFSVTSQPEGHETALTGSYQVFDTSGRRVADHTFPTEREICRNRRRDFFIPYRVYMPKSLAPGKYTLQLTIEDVHAEKFGQGSIQFTIKN